MVASSSLHSPLVIGKIANFFRVREAMLSIEKCRKLIPGREEYTDEQILSIRDELYELADIAIQHYLEDLKMGRIPEGETMEK